MAQRRQLHDRFFKQAKAEGYAARSAYKLKEIQEKFRVLRKGTAVLDLGCAPGSWLQVAGELVKPGEGGIVVGIDLQEVTARLGPGTITMRGDIFATPAEVFLHHLHGPDSGAADGVKGGAETAKRKFDAVISDMAPSTTGHGDEFLSERLCRRVMDLLPALLAPGGAAVMKVLEGEPFPALLKDVKSAFRSGAAFKPQSSRDVSREIFIVALGYKGAGERGNNGGTDGAGEGAGQSAAGRKRGWT